MKIVKPFRCSLLQKTYCFREQSYLCTKPIIFFDLEKSKNFISEIDGWKRFLSCLPKNYGFDDGLPKGNSEVLVVGSAHVPGGSEVKKMNVALEFGAIKKSLQVTGNRIWYRNIFGQYRASNPTPFSSMPITWENAFGFAGWDQNDVGQGALSKGVAGETIIALPNVEEPDDKLRKPSRQIRPAGFGPISPLWKPRNLFSAAFDEEHVKWTFPALPDDLDFRLYNLAPADQQLPEIGLSEQFRLTNLSPMLPVLEGTLPGVYPRVFISKNSELTEVPTQLETTWLVPDAGLGVLFFRGECPTESSLAQLEFDGLMIGLESASDTPRGLDYYDEVYRLRTDPETSYQHAMNDSQLMPILPTGEQRKRRDEHQRAVAAAQQKQALAWEATRQDFTVNKGLEIDSAQSPDPIDSRMIISPEAMERRDFSLEPQLQVVREKQVEGEQLRSNVKAQSSVANSYAPTRNMAEADAALEADILRRAEKRDLAQGADTDVLETGSQANQLELYKLQLAAAKSASSPSPKSFVNSQVAGSSLRKLLETLIDKGEDLTFRDFTGADFTELDLSNLDLEGSILENANLRGAIFNNSNLSETSLVGADISDASFMGATLDGANLSSSRGDFAVFSGAVFRKRIYLNIASLRCCDFSGCEIEGLLIIDSCLVGSSLQGSRLKNITVSNTDLRCSDWSESVLDTVVIVGSNLQQSLFKSIKADRGGILNSQVALTQWESCELSNWQFGGEVMMSASSFTDCTFELCGFRKAHGSLVSITGSAFIKSDVSMLKMPEVNLSNSSFAECLSHASYLREGDLSNSLFYQSMMDGTDLKNSILDQADFLQSDVLSVNFEGSNYREAVNINPIKLDRLSV